MRKVNELLREKRKKKNLSLDDVERATKIKKKYLLALEEGKFDTLPSESYALGFLKNYAEFLGIPTPTISALFRREYEDRGWEIIPEFRKKQALFSKRILFSTKGIFVIGAFLVIISYIIFQYNSFFFGPKLEVLTPQNNKVIKGNIIEVKGKTDPYATVLIDSDESYVALDGIFKKSIYAFPGEKKIVIVAKNRFGRENITTINVTVK